MAALLGSIFIPQGSVVALLLLVAAAIAIDFGVQANLVLGFRAIFCLAPEARGRLNGVYLVDGVRRRRDRLSARRMGLCARRVGACMLCRLAPPLIALARFLIGVATGKE